MPLEELCQVHAYHHFSSDKTILFVITLRQPIFPEGPRGLALLVYYGQAILEARFAPRSNADDLLRVIRPDVPWWEFCLFNRPVGPRVLGRQKGLILDYDVVEYDPGAWRAEWQIEQNWGFEYGYDDSMDWQTEPVYYAMSMA